MYPRMLLRYVYWILALVTVTHGYTATISDVTTSYPKTDEPCPTGSYGPGCNGTCHCLTSPLRCNPQDGRCLDGICDGGWTGAPFCQTECPDDWFGAGCQFKCHCQTATSCDRVNGTCLNSSCADGWAGHSCQIPLPVMESPPNVTFVSCHQITLVWSSQPQTADVCDPDTYLLYSYTLQQSVDSQKTWTDVIEIWPSPSEGNQDKEIEYRVPDPDPSTPYVFRVRPNALIDRRPVPGVVGPVSSTIPAGDHCDVTHSSASDVNLHWNLLLFLVWTFLIQVTSR